MEATTTTIIEIIELLITGGAIFTAIKMARDWKSERREQEANSKKSDYQAQREGLDLVSEFYEKVKELTDGNSNKITSEIKEIKSDLRAIHEEQRRQAEEQRRQAEEQKMQSDFLNGEYQKYKKKKKNC